MSTYNDLFYIGANPSNPRRLLWLPLQELRRHCLITGSSGTGKSMLVVDQFMQRVVAGESCIVIDPKGDLVRDILACIALMPEEEWAELARDIVIVDPADTLIRSGFNPFEITAHGSASRQRQDVVSAFRRIFEFDDSRVTRLVLVMRRSVQLAIEHGLTMVDLPRLLTDGEFRDRLVQQSGDEDVQRFWQHEFPQGKANQQQWTASTLVRLETLLDDPAVKRFFGYAHSTFDFRDIMDTGKVCLVSLSKGAIGEETSRLLGGFLMSRLQLAAESRATLPTALRRPCTVFVDEFQNFVTSTFGELIAEARGFGLSLVMAHQHLGQLPDELRHAALSNANIRVSFRLRADDAAVMAKEFFRLSGQRVKNEWWNVASIGPLPIPYKEYKYFSVSEEARQNRDLIQHLPDRHLVAHVAGESNPYLVRTVDLPLAEMSNAGARVHRLKEMIVQAQATRITASEPTRLPVSAPPRSGGLEWRPATRASKVPAEL